MSPSLATPALFERLRDARRVIVAGAGGGFDVYAGLPLALELWERGAEVHLGNLSFTYLGGTDAAALAPHFYAVTPSTAGEDRYFPERCLAVWLAAQGLPSTVHAFDKVGVVPLRDAWRMFCARVQPDAVVLVDGGTDILMTGDEAGLGTPSEDMASLAAVSALEGVPTRIVLSIGFGVDAYHGVCHAHVLENIAALDRDGAYLGAFSVPRATRAGALFVDAVAHAQRLTPRRPSIVNGSIAAAVSGQFGDAHFTDRTAGSELFINPLMALYFAFDLPGVVRRSRYLHLLEDTRTIFEVSARIEAFHREAMARSWRPIPH